MQRVKNVQYDEDELYSDEGETAEDRENFATLTPVVRAELEEAGLQASDRDIEEALWHYYWDVGKSVAYLKNTRAPKQQQQPPAKKEKAKTMSKFDEAAQRSAAKTGESSVSFAAVHGALHGQERIANYPRGGNTPPSTPFSHTLTSLAEHPIMPPTSAADWFRDVPWHNVPAEMHGLLAPSQPEMPRPKLLGGSSKLAKLAEERRKKAAAAAEGPAITTNGALSSLDRLSRPKEVNENEDPAPKPEPKKYPIRKKREPTPPPREPTPPPAPPEEEKPDLRASPSQFGWTLSTSPPSTHAPPQMTLKDMVGSEVELDSFKGPSPDDVVIRAQQHSKGLNK
jgi:elongation factor 1 alpha-like protein